MVFFQFRQQTLTLQGVLIETKSDKDDHQVSRQMLKYAQSIPVSPLQHYVTAGLIR